VNRKQIERQITDHGNVVVYGANVYRITGPATTPGHWTADRWDYVKQDWAAGRSLASRDLADYRWKHSLESTVTIVAHAQHGADRRKLLDAQRAATRIGLAVDLARNPADNATVGVTVAGLLAASWVDPLPTPTTATTSTEKAVSWETGGDVALAPWALLAILDRHGITLPDPVELVRPPTVSEADWAEGLPVLRRRLDADRELRRTLIDIRGDVGRRMAARKRAETGQRSYAWDHEAQVVSVLGDGSAREQLDRARAWLDANPEPVTA
jgi:hypothetical protein